MKKEEFNVTENKTLVVLIAGFISLLAVFSLLGSSFNELLTLSLFFLFTTVVVASFVWGDHKSDKSRSTSKK